jgi:hypothetical protein
MNQEMDVCMAKLENEAQTRWDLPFGSLPEIDFHADAFSLSIEPVEEGGVPRIETSHKSRRAPDIHVMREGNVVRVRIGTGRGIPLLDWIPWNAGSTLTLRVPANLHGRIHTGAGTLQAEDLDDCDLALVTDAGTIQVERIRGNLRLMTAAGTIDGSDLEGSINAETHAGTIDLSVLSLDPGVHRIHTSAGTVRVDLARDIEARIDATSNFGASRVKFPSTHDAAATLVVSSDAGTVRVRASHHKPHHKSRRPPREHVAQASPYRHAAPPPPVATSAKATTDSDATNGELDRVLQMVADGTLSPEDAGEVLRALGHG